MVLVKVEVILVCRAVEPVHFARVSGANPPGGKYSMGVAGIFTWVCIYG